MAARVQLIGLLALCTYACSHMGPGVSTAFVPTAAEKSKSVERTLRLVNGQWLLGGRFVSVTRYAVGSTLRDHYAARPDSTLDLHGGFVVPPFGEAHNHNIEASSRVDALIARYLRDGVFYVENPNVLPRNRAALAGKVNVPTGVDVIFANGGLTGSGGHPIEIVRRNSARGIWTAADGEGEFYWVVDNSADLARKWPAILAQRNRLAFLAADPVADRKLVRTCHEFPFE